MLCRLSQNTTCAIEHAEVNDQGHVCPQREEQRESFITSHHGPKKRDRSRHHCTCAASKDQPRLRLDLVKNGLVTTGRSAKRYEIYVETGADLSICHLFQLDISEVEVLISTAYGCRAKCFMLRRAKEERDRKSVV